MTACTWGEQLTPPHNDARHRDGSETARDALNLLTADLRAARRRLRISQAGLAEALGIAPLAITNWESGKDTPTTGNFVRWAEALGYVVDVADRRSRQDTARPVPLKGESFDAYRVRCMLLFLAEVRRERDYTQEMVAESLGVSSWTVHMWETARRNPRLLRLIEWCSVFGCRLTLNPV